VEEWAEREIDPPFSIFSVEHARDVLMHMVIKGRKANVECAWCKEVAPKEYEVILFCSTVLNGGPGTRFIVRSLPGDVFHENALVLIRAATVALARTSLGVQKTVHRIRLGKGKSRRLKKISNVVHCIPKKHLNEYLPSLNAEFDFSHRFEVRGHWRKTPTIGKNRQGVYGTQGFTWVVPHEKGPEHLPLVKKTREVHA
jgi:hypothetical protein